jgi:undecaprenyl-diphosphatase
VFHKFQQKILFCVPNLFMLLTGPSRIYLGDHWPGDVLGGYLLGGSILNLFRWLYIRLK